MVRFTAFLLLSLAVTASVRADEPRRDRAVMVEEIDAIKAGFEQRASPDGQPTTRKRLVLRPDLAGIDRPNSPDVFRSAWHQPPICQGLTGQCWAFAATSFAESEVARTTDRKIRLSESWTVYWEFIEKARRFIRQKGESEFPRGSEPNAVRRLWKYYGVVPAEAYKGLSAGRDFCDDRAMYRAMAGYLSSLKQKGQWDEAAGIAGIRQILDRYMGAPPEACEVDGVRMSPRDYADRVIRLNTDEYVVIMSLMSEPFSEWCKFDVPDNWWQSRGYYNVSLDDFTRVLRETARDGGTICVSIDDTEAGFYYRQGLAVVPSFDLPSAFIDNGARQLRFANESTTDDHVVHLVGCQEHAGRWWYLIKDSGTHAHNAPHPGYMIYDEDYLRLKALGLMLPRTTVERTLGRHLGPMPVDADDLVAASTQVDK